MSHLELDFGQIGYQKNRACADNIAILTADVEAAFSRGEDVLCVFFDLSGAFERVPHQLLISELLDEAAAMTESNRREFMLCVRWVDAFLKNRTNAVRLGDTISAPLHVPQGVPQGTVSGPSCWKFYFNKLLVDLRRQGCQFLCYADDLAIYLPFKCRKTAAVHLQAYIRTVENWCSTHNMEVSIDKTNYIIFSKSGQKTAVKLEVDGVPIEYCENPRFLGVRLDSKLSMEKQLDVTIAKCNRRLAAIRKLSRASWGPRCIHIWRLYDALVTSVLSYGAGAWMPRLSDKGLERINGVIFAGAKLILGVPAKTQTRAAIHEANLLPAQEFAAREAAILYTGAYARSRWDDPLLKSASALQASWAKLGFETCTDSGVFPINMEKEFVATIDEKVDLWADIVSGELTLTCQEAKPADVQRYHAACDGVYYTDGSAVRSRGSASCVRFVANRGGNNLFEVVGAYPLKIVADSFLAEQKALLDAVYDAKRRCKRGDRVTILTDSLSNILSLRSPGIRDRVEREIMEALHEMCQEGVRTEIRFVRGHSQCCGNDLADVVAGMVTRDRSHFIPYERRRIPRNLAKCRIRAETKSIATHKLAFKTPGHTADELKINSDFNPNPVVAGVKHCTATRRNECAYNQLRLGVTIFDQRFREWEHGRCPPCWRCGEPSGTKHILFTCRMLDCERASFRKAFEEDRSRRLTDNEKKRAAGRGENDFEEILTWGDPYVLQEAPVLVLDFLQKVRFF